MSEQAHAVELQPGESGTVSVIPSEGYVAIASSVAFKAILQHRRFGQRIVVFGTSYSTVVLEKLASGNWDVEVTNFGAPAANVYVSSW